MPAYTNWITPTSMNRPPHGKGDLSYRTHMVTATSPTALTTGVNNFLDSLAVNGQPWPHLIDIKFEVLPQEEEANEGVFFYALIVYLLTG